MHPKQHSSGLSALQYKTIDGLRVRFATNDKQDGEPAIVPGARYLDRALDLIEEIEERIDERGASPDFEIPAIPEFGSPDWTAWNTGHYAIRTHPREIVENLADRAHFPSVHQTEIDDFEFSVDGHMATQRVKGRALLPGGGVDRFGSTTTYHGPGLLLMRMGGVMQNYMIVAHTPVDSMSLELRMGVMLKNVAAATEMERLVALYMKNLKAGFEDDIRIWENKLYRDVPVLCDGDGPITQLRRWYRQFYVAREQPLAEQRA